MCDRFTKEEVVQKGTMPYFPMKKVAELLGVEAKEMLLALANMPEIMDGVIVVEDLGADEKEMYFSPIACVLLIEVLPVKTIGKKIKQMSSLIMNGLSQNRTSYAKRMIRISPPFLKAIFEWSDLVERDNFDLEHEGGPEPVQ